MRLIEKILSDENLKEAIKRVKSNKGASGIDKMTVDEIDSYFNIHKDEIISSIMNKKYKPQPVKRVYIPKSNGKLRPLGIPIVIDRVIQQAIAQELSLIYEPYFSNNSYGFRPNRDCHKAIERALSLINGGYEWIIDLDIEKFFDTVNHDKLISILRERVFDSCTLHLIRSFLRAGIMEDGLVKSSIIGMPQGGPLSPILSNIYLDKLDKELESRGLNFVRYADDTDIFVKSEMSANRVMVSIIKFIEKKLFLKVNATKTKVVRPTNSEFLGFTFFKTGDLWKARPTNSRKMKLYDKCREVLVRKTAVSIPLSITFTKLNQIVKGWINYFKIGSMKLFITKFGEWLRHKVRVIILKSWKNPRTIFKNLKKLNEIYNCNISDYKINGAANTRLGWYKRTTGNVVSFIISPKLLETSNKKRERPGLVNPLNYYLS